MKQEATLIRARLKTPRVATVAGILFSVLLITGLLLFRIHWILPVFPLWVLLISIYILIDNLRRPSQTAATSPGQTNSY